MRLVAESRVLEFFPLRLMFGGAVVTDVFARKNNKTVAETLAHRRYKHLWPIVRDRYPESLNRKLGEFLKASKQTGDLFYLRFLNRYGDETYCKFWIERSAHSDQKGLYCFALAGELKYIGKTTSSFGKRINQGYGTISPKNCYLDGQATNCHLNALITRTRGLVELSVCPLGRDSEIGRLERILIRKYQPEWNVALAT
jgi:hypothetical protein